MYNYYSAAFVVFKYIRAFVEPKQFLCHHIPFGSPTPYLHIIQNKEKGYQNGVYGQVFITTSHRVFVDTIHQIITFTIGEYLKAGAWPLYCYATWKMPLCPRVDLNPVTSERMLDPNRTFRTRRFFLAPKTSKILLSLYSVNIIYNDWLYITLLPLCGFRTNNIMITIS